MKLSDQISVALQKFACGNTDIVIPNFYVGMYEMDVFRLLNNGLLYEYEIKISRSDFKADFKKGNKHKLIATKKSPCNRFYYVTPEGLIHPNELPDYAGLIEYWGGDKDNIGFCRLVKNAKLIHKEKTKDSVYKNIAYKLSFREANWRYKVNRLLKLNKEK